MGFTQEYSREGEDSEQVKGVGIDSSELWVIGSISSRLVCDTSVVTSLYDSPKGVSLDMLFLTKITLLLFLA